VSDWQRTPTTVQGEFLSLLQRLDAVEVRLHCKAETLKQERARIMIRIKGWLSSQGI
jgi:hypothetical protein